ncbi:PREDICTED: probable lysosomal cobalamin transporter [Propithecus coquereli]|uniref:probable lysosomal cobalamin transporter n=1 Tax=Propithecus coquereli TaxID=379532 RepID=UPI00063EE086|nr:PREDICTED: probable lysosomal cobalamin transporter [Propithecus coquereli]
MAVVAAGAASADLVIGWCIFGLLLLDWANANVSRQIEDTVLYGYYTLYSVILFCVFFWIPFVYFYYEEKDDDDTSKCTQIKTALKYTLGFAVICALLLLVGAFVPLNVPNNKNSTEWEKVKFLFEELGSSLKTNQMLKAIAYGMSALPLNLIKGTRSTAYERLENTEDIEEVEQHIQTIKSKSKDGRPLPARDKRALKQFEERLRTLKKRERHLEFIENSWWTKFCGALRPLKIIWGVFFILVALLFIISLFLSNLDKALHSAGIDSGFIIFGTNLSNPLNMLLPLLQTIRNIGIWFFWIRLYKIRRGRTRPQALLFLCMILLLIVLHTSYMIYSLAPQYVMYGSQNYLIESNITSDDHKGNSTLSVPKRCDADAPEGNHCCHGTWAEYATTAIGACHPLVSAAATTATWVAPPLTALGGQMPIPPGTTCHSMLLLPPDLDRANVHSPGACCCR